MKMKARILGVVDEWIGICNDDINHNLDRILDHTAERHLRDLYDRKIELVKFQAAFSKCISAGPSAYSDAMLAEMVEYIIDIEESTS